MKAKQSVDNVRHFGIEFKGQYEARQGKGVHEIVRDLNDSTLKSSFDTNNVDQILVDSLNTKQLLSQSVVESHAQSSRDSPKDSNTMYCYRHRPDSMCRRTADEPTMEALSKVSDILLGKISKISTILESKNFAGKRAGSYLPSLVSIL